MKGRPAAIVVAGRKIGVAVGIEREFPKGIGCVQRRKGFAVDALKIPLHLRQLVQCRAETVADFLALARAHTAYDVPRRFSKTVCIGAVFLSAALRFRFFVFAALSRGLGKLLPQIFERLPPALPAASI